ncbi:MULTISPECIES: hypothetical protein [Prauserella salsuginis group]|uniref:Uncharacterized protein n=2 Tax=Prauserella salsuginis group TaxID=2893672 RepID=A0A839XRG3_9PSEU|nr:MULTISPECIES: hypothetical protein [Prauserella salsuginis group]MBB3666382.1 hypothetical protein [Prauserella sediminis]MCR3719171.1 hypothetical protein [Prauserella flava]MCR3735816.1 hypothetical protein [Prauserella salsuginis]
MAATDIDRIEAVTAHAREHGLVGTISTIGVGGALPPTVWLNNTQAFIPWARAVSAETLTAHGNYQTCSGTLRDGTPVLVQAARGSEASLTIAVEDHPESGESA